MNASSDISGHTKPIDSDFVCANCGYNLRGVPADGNCPECGYSVAASIRLTDSLTARGLFVIALRITAIVLFCVYLPGMVGSLTVSLTYLGSFLTGNTQQYLVLSSAVQIVVLCVMGVGVWVFAPRLSLLAIREDMPFVANDRGFAEQIHRAGCGVFFVFFSAYAFINLVWMTYYIANGDASPSQYSVDEDYERFIKSLVGAVTFAAAAWFMLWWPHGFWASLRWLRTIGTKLDQKLPSSHE